MLASELSIYAIIRKKKYELLKPDLIDYFPNNSSVKKIYEACFMARMRGADATPEYVKNYVSQNHKGAEKTAILGDLHNIIQGDKYIDALDIERQLEIEFYNTQWSKINNMLIDQKATLAMKKDIIKQTSDIINRTKHIDDFESIKKLLQESHALKLEGKESILSKHSIQLEDPNLIRIFGGRVFPHPHLILARPNSYKTTFLYNIIYEFSKLKKRGIIMSLEDTAEMASIKLMAVMSGLNKVELITGNYVNKQYEEALTSIKNNIFVMDKIRTPDEMYVDLKNKLMAGEFDYIAVDFIQGVKRDKYQTETEKIQRLTEVLFEINKEFMIPIFQLSQAPKSEVQKKDHLGMGDEKGASEIAEKSRWSCSINPLRTTTEQDKNDPYEEMLINIYKTTLSGKGQVKIIFHKTSGQIHTTEKLDG